MILFRHALVPLLSLLPLQPSAAPARAEDVRYPSGELELAAELLLPEGAHRAPAAVVLQGSGDSDRTNSWAAAIAGVLADAGVVTLLTDKRGCGASDGSWLAADFEDLADDALAGVAYLKERPEVDPARIGVVGLSQGGWVAPVAAARSGDVAFVIDVSGASVGFVEQLTVEMTNTARRAGLSEGPVATVLELNRAAGRYALRGDWEPYAALRARALESEAKPVAAGFPDTRDHPKWTFIRGVATFDPLPYWAAVDQPTLVLYGEEDEQDNVPVAESVHRLEFLFGITGKTNAEIVVVPGAGHAFIDPEVSQLMPEFVEHLESWVERVLHP